MKSIRLKNADIELTLIPEIGGKITSLINRRTSREWIWCASETRDFRPVGDETDFARVNLGGIDECLPTIQRQQYEGFDYPDHGEIWRLPVRVIEESDIRIVTEVTLSVAPLKFRRTIELQGSGAHFFYEISNLSHHFVPFIWAFHPLLRLAVDDQIHLPDEIHPLQIDYCENLAGCRSLEFFSWPHISPGVDLSLPLVDAGIPYCAKLFFESAHETTLKLVCAESSDSLAVSFSGPQCPYFGLWINAGSWNGFTHVAFEPTNYPSDRFDGKRPPSGLKPGAFSKWSVTINVQP